MGRDVRVSRDVGIGARRSARANAMDELANVFRGRVVARALARRQQRLQVGRDFDASAVAGLDPAFGAFEPVAAGPSQPQL